MNQSTNYNFNLPEGSDLVNLLTQLIPNWSNIDTILKGVEDQALTNCTEVVSLGVHAISRSNADGKILKWIATANYTAGDTFTVDGNVVAASTPSGATLATNAYVSGAVIIAALNSDESAMTIFVTGSNVAADSEKLGGELPAYYAKQSDMNTAQLAITDLDNLMGTTSISGIGDGTATGAISAMNLDISNITEYSPDVYVYGKVCTVFLHGDKIFYSIPTPAKNQYMAARTININNTNFGDAYLSYGGNASFTGEIGASVYGVITFIIA